MISVTAHVNSKKLLGFIPFAEDRLRDLVHDGTEFGELTMTVLVPRGQSGRLSDAVGSSVVSVSEAHTVGTVGVNQAIAPYADMVDRGTGIDGPLGRPVTVLRPAKTGRGPGNMAFTKNGEQQRVRRVVKAAPSVKIERSKNFSGRTFDRMVDWTRLHTSVLSREYALYFADDHQ